MAHNIQCYHLSCYVLARNTTQQCPVADNDSSNEVSDRVITWHEVAAAPLGTNTVYPKKYAHGFCFAVLCCGYTLTDFPISIRLTSLALWQSNDCPSATKATLMNMDKYFMWIHYERLHNHNKAKHNKTVCIFLGISCRSSVFHGAMGCFGHFILPWIHIECISKRIWCNI